MKRILTLIAVLLSAAAFTAQWSSEARAQNLISYISPSGDDRDGCSDITTACSTFSGALAKTRDGGTIQCHDGGFFFAGQINISVTIDCLPGSAGTGFTINAPGKTVTLRNIVMIGFGLGAVPVDIQAAASVYIENCSVAQGSPGIKDHRAGPGVLVIRNSSIVGNTGENAGVGILVAPSSGTIGVELDNVNSASNRYGLAVGSGGRVMIKNSVFTGNTAAGIKADGGAFVGISSSEISFNSTGISSGGTVSLQSSSIVSNTTAIQGATQSLGNNRIFANSGNGTPPTIVSGQ